MIKFYAHISPLILFMLIYFLPTGCRKNPTSCADYVPTAPYSNPLWHPNGQVLGFNRLPLKAVFKDENVCGGYTYDYYNDSIGFWLINKDGNNLRRVTNFQLLTPAWSPDGKWIAFCNGGTIYNMVFDGNNFDTAHILTLTNNAASNFFPSWNTSGDSIYYDSDKAAPGGTSFYAIWKMAADGTGQIRVTKDLNEGGREPFYKSTDEILFIRFVNQTEQVFSMDSNGDNVRQITTAIYSHNYSKKEYPEEFNGKIYYEDFGIWSINNDGSGLQQLCLGSVENFSISRDGTVAWVNYDYSRLDKTLGTIWLMNTDGSNKRQFTFNNY